MLAPAAVPVVATGITFTAISATVVLCRLITRLVVIKNAGADDYFMLAALISSFGFLIVVMFQVKYGLGSHISDVLAQGTLEKFLQCLWATIPVYNLTLTLCKLSIICQYMRVFTTEKVIKLCKIMLGVLVVYGCWTIFGSAFMCLPVAYFWDESIKGGHCMSKLGFWFSNSALNITTDLMIFAIPMPLLKQLQLPKKQKIGLMFVFAFGAFVCVTSIIRLKSLYDISVSPDTTFAGAGTAIWTSIEINVAISCSSLPALKPLIAKAFPHLLSTGHSRTKSNMYANMSGNGGIGGSHHMETLSSKVRGGDRDKDKKDDNSSSSDMKVTIQQTVDVYRQSDSVRPASREGSERSLVGWKAEVFCEEPRAKQPHQHV